jgi:cytoskeletal protein CcmA (bactofilin family)
MSNQEPFQNEAGRMRDATGQEGRPGVPGSTTPAAERRVVAWVGKSVIFRGELISSEDMTVDGRVEGTIEVREHTLTVGPDAELHADIAADTVHVLGAVIGSITARQKVVIGEQGSVEGDIVAARVAVVDGAVLRGRVETAAKREPQGQVADVI